MSKHIHSYGCLRLIPKGTTVAWPPKLACGFPGPSPKQLLKLTKVTKAISYSALEKAYKAVEGMKW